MWPYPWTHVGTPSHLGHMDRVAATMPSQAHAGAAQEAPDIGQWEGQDVPLVRPSSCNVKGGIPSSRRYLPTYLLSFREYRSQHTGCWVCYGKGNNHAHDHRHCKVYEEDKKTYFAAQADRKPKEQRIADWKAKGGDGAKGQGKGQGKGRGKGYGGGPGPDRRGRSIEEVAEDMLRTLEELKAQQRGGQSLSGSQQERAAAGHV